MLVITAGFTGDEPLRRALLDAVRQHGMRLIGPNCLGLVNTDPQVRPDVTFSDQPTSDGPVGVATQSGGAGIALLDQFGHLGYWGVDLGVVGRPVRRQQQRRAALVAG